MASELTRRELIQTGAAGAAALGLYGLFSDSVGRALSAPAQCGQLSDIEHVVILIQENRSFDHYFGTYKGVRGFADTNVLPLKDGSGLTVFAQPGYPPPGYGGHLLPFHFDTQLPNNGECVNDIDHEWARSTAAGTAAAWTASSRSISPTTETPTGPTRWATTSDRICPSTTRSPTPSRSVTASIAR